MAMDRYGPMISRIACLFFHLLIYVLTRSLIFGSSFWSSSTRYSTPVGLLGAALARARRVGMAVGLGLGLELTLLMPPTVF